MAKYIYEYTGSGVQAFEIDKKRYVVGKNDYRIKDFVELLSKLKDSEANRLGLKLKKGEE